MKYWFALLFLLMPRADELYILGASIGNFTMCGVQSRELQMEAVITVVVKKF